MGRPRRIKRARLVGAPSGVSIRTRLRPSEEEEAVLWAVASHLGSLAGRDLRAALGCRRGCAEVSDPEERAAIATASLRERKRSLTAQSSSRYAGTITRATNDQIALAEMAQTAHRDDLAASIAAIERRLAIQAGRPGKTSSDKGGKTASGYRDGSERAAKQQRLQILKVRLTRVEADMAAGILRITRGGKGLLNTRHHLEEAGITLAQWQDAWRSKRDRIAANGSHDETGGNLTIRVTPDGTMSILLPVPLRHLSNTGRGDGRYTLAVKALFSYRRQDWLDCLSSGEAVSYEIAHDTVKGRWHMTASWSTGARERRKTRAAAKAAAKTGIPATAKAAPSPVLSRPAISVGVDLNAGHLDCWALDASGNPVGRPLTIPFSLRGSSGRRDAQLRQAITTLLRFARAASGSGATRRSGTWSRPSRPPASRCGYRPWPTAPASR